VTVRTTGYNQEGTVVITFRRTPLVYRRGAGPEVLRPTVELLSATSQREARK
jgi:itaconyl-CoA hydratase